MAESALLTRRRCAEVFAQVADAARALGAGDVEAMMGASTHALTRFANNTIHQNVADRGGHLSVRVLLDGRTARAGTNRMDPASIRAVVEQAVAITRVQEASSDLLPLAPPQPITPVERWFASTAEATPQDRARTVAEAIRLVESHSLIAAGIYATSESALAILNSRGVFAYHAETMAQFSITAMGGDSSGWAKASGCDRESLDTAKLAASAAEKAVASSHPRELAPGRYRVILEPAAVLDLAGQIFLDFSGTALHEGRSFLTGRVGSKLFDERIEIADDVYHPQQAGAPFDGEGVPRQRLTLVERGVVRQLAYSRHAARLAGVEPTGHGFPLPSEEGEAPMNIVMAGGASSVAEMIATTERGILVTRLWYIREVDPYEKIMTGMTRDGTFLVDNGRVASGLRNFRFNQGLVELLSNVEALSPPARASGEEAFDMVVPAMKARDFQFTEVTKF